MAHLDTGIDREAQGILRDVLHTVATASEPLQGMIPLLEMARTLTDADFAAFILFNDPQHLILNGIQEADLPDQTMLHALADSLTPGIHVDPTLPDSLTLHVPHSVFSSVRLQRLVGLLWLGFEQPGMQGIELLEALIDGLTTLSRQARTIARHEKIARNQTEFLRIVLHDLRSPLTSMMGFGSMLESGTVGELSEQQKHFVSRIMSGINQMTMLVDNVQDAGRYDPETGFYEMQRDMCDLVDMVQRVVQNHLVPAEKGELTISTAISDEIPIISADVTMLERAVTNLIDNAIKYTPNQGHVEVGLSRQDETIIVSVKDSGLGISPDNQRQLFERHFRIPRNEHKKIKGSGLGLFIVRSVAQRHGGTAWVESVEGEGSTFFISIPMYESNHAGMQE